MLKSSKQGVGGFSLFPKNLVIASTSLNKVVVQLTRWSGIFWGPSSVVLGNVKVRIPKVQCKLVNWVISTVELCSHFQTAEEEEGALNEQALARKARKKTSVDGYT